MTSHIVLHNLSRFFTVGFVEIILLVITPGGLRKTLKARLIECSWKQGVTLSKLTLSNIISQKAKY